MSSSVVFDTLNQTTFSYPQGYCNNDKIEKVLIEGNRIFINLLQNKTLPVLNISTETNSFAEIYKDNNTDFCRKTAV